LGWILKKVATMAIGSVLTASVTILDRLAWLLYQGSLGLQGDCGVVSFIAEDHIAVFLGELFQMLQTYPWFFIRWFSIYYWASYAMSLVEPCKRFLWGNNVATPTLTGTSKNLRFEKSAFVKSGSCIINLPRNRGFSRCPDWPTVCSKAMLFDQSARTVEHMWFRVSATTSPMLTTLKPV
jgi:hypothetical protein